MPIDDFMLKSIDGFMLQPACMNECVVLDQQREHIAHLQGLGCRVQVQGLGCRVSGAV